MDLPDPEIKYRFPTLQACSLPSEPLGRPNILVSRTVKMWEPKKEDRRERREEKNVPSVNTNRWRLQQIIFFLKFTYFELKLNILFDLIYY